MIYDISITLALYGFKEMKLLSSWSMFSLFEILFKTFSVGAAAAFRIILNLFLLVYNEESEITISIVCGSSGSGNSNPGMASARLRP